MHFPIAGRHPSCGPESSEPAGKAAIQTSRGPEIQLCLSAQAPSKARQTLALASDIHSAPIHLRSLAGLELSPRTSSSTGLSERRTKRNDLLSFSFCCYTVVVGASLRLLGREKFAKPAAAFSLERSCLAISP